MRRPSPPDSVAAERADRDRHRRASRERLHRGRDLSDRLARRQGPARRCRRGDVRGASTRSGASPESASGATFGSCRRAIRSIGPRAAAGARRRADRGRVAAPARAGDGRRAADRRPRARVRRGRRQEPPAPLRGRRRRPQPPADERALARRAARARAVGLPWLVLRGRAPWRACSGTGRCSRSTTRPVRGLGQDVLAAEFDVERRGRAAAGRGRPASSARRSRASALVAGIGNMWMAEALWEVRVSPWVRVAGRERRDVARGPRRPRGG